MGIASDTVLKSARTSSGGGQYQACQLYRQITYKTYENVDFKTGTYLLPEISNKNINFISPSENTKEIHSLEDEAYCVVSGPCATMNHDTAVVNYCP